MQGIRRTVRNLAVASVCAVASMIATVPGTGGVAGAATTKTAFYLDLGASQSVGVQPVAGSRHGQPTNRGYANYLVAMEAAKGVSLQLTQLGCPGEATTIMISGKDHCYKGIDSQLADAVAFLRSHQNQVGVVTVELGFNNAGHCLSAAALIDSCMNSRMSVLSQQLSQILSTLKAAAGPNVTIIGLGHADPFLAYALNGTAGTASANASLKVIEQLNATLSSVYSSFAIPMVDVAGAFNMTQTNLIAFGGAGSVALNVAQACRLTWMCPPAPQSPNMHPNDAGYRVIASAIAAMLPSTL